MRTRSTGAEQVARAFQDLAEQRVRECLGSLKGDDRAIRKVAGQIGTPHAIDELREFADILRARDALGVIGSRLPPTISNLADEQLENVKALLDSPIGRHRDVFLYALLVVMSRLGSPWQLIRLAIHAAATDVAARIAETPFAVAVEVVLTDLDRIIANLHDSLKAGRAGEVAFLLKDFHDAARALAHRNRSLGRLRPGAASLRPRAPQVAKLLASRDRLSARSGAPPVASAYGQGNAPMAPTRCERRRRDRGEARSRRRLPQLRGRTRGQRGDAAACTSELQNYFDSGTQVLLDRLRTSPPAERAFRQSQVDAAVRFCATAVRLGIRQPLAKAADVAAKGEQKAAKA